MRVHRNRHERSFVVVPNAAARHHRLSLTARGLLVTLLSLPDGTRATIDTVADQVDEGRRAVAKAFNALEGAGYLRRDRAQDPDTGLWGTQTHVSDLPMDRIPAAGEPQGRNVGDLPKGEKNQGKNLLPASSAKDDTDEAAEAGAEEEGENPQDEQAPPADPTDAETGRAASVLAKLGDTDRRLTLGTADVLRLAPLAAAWLADGHSPAKVQTVLTTRLPEHIDAPAALVSYRLKNHRPAKAATTTPAPDTRARCQQCSAVFAAGVIRDLCKTCASEARLDEPAQVGGEAAGLIASIRQRRAAGTFAKGAKSRFLPVMPAAA